MFNCTNLLHPPIQFKRCRSRTILNKPQECTVMSLDFYRYPSPHLEHPFSSPLISSSFAFISSCLSIHLSFLPSLLSRPDEEECSDLGWETAVNVTGNYLKWAITFEVINISQSSQERLNAFRNSL